MTDKALKFWSGNSVPGGGRKDVYGFEKFHIAAYSFKDALQLYEEVFGTGRGSHNFLKDYCHNAWGTPAHKFITNPQRGTYLTDEHYTAVMFKEPKSRSIIEDVPEEAKVIAAAAPMPENYGTLRVGFDRGRKIDEWTFSAPHADRALADRMKAEVRMEHSDQRRDKERYEHQVEFVATSECFGKGISLRHQNIEKLFDMVQDAFRTYDIAQRGVVWEDWLEITVHNESSFGSKESSGLSVGYTHLKRGVDPRNGRVMTINNNHVVTDFPKPKNAGERDKNPKTGKENKDDGSLRDYFHEREKEYQYAYMPATKDNIAALNTIMVAIHTARTRLNGLLNQRDISKTLAAIPSIPLLEKK
mgnify:FL=1